MAGFSTFTSKATTLIPAATSALRRILHGFGQTVLDDDALHAKCDGLIDHIGLKRRILPRIEDLKVDTKRRRLLFHAER